MHDPPTYPVDRACCHGNYDKHKENSCSSRCCNDCKVFCVQDWIGGPLHRGIGRVSIHYIIAILWNSDAADARVCSFHHASPHLYKWIHSDWMELLYVACIYVEVWKECGSARASVVHHLHLHIWVHAGNWADVSNKHLPVRRPDQCQSLTVRERSMCWHSGRRRE